MAYTSYYCDDLRILVFQPPNVSPEPHDPAPLFVQLELTISIELSFIRHDCSVDQFSPDREPFFSQETLRFDLHLLRERSQLTEIVASMLTRLRIRPSTPLLEAILDKLIRRGAPLLNCTSGMGRIVLPLHAKLGGTGVRHVRYDESEVLERVVAILSESELERGNYGMVPAKESSVMEMLGRVGVGAGESSVKDQDCAICLEGFDVGSMASELPCFHAFHEKCIEKWLKLSHYCPVCRFELPTEEC